MTLLTVSAAAKLAKTSRTAIYNAIERKQLTVADANVKLLNSEDVVKWARREKPKGGRPKKEQAE